MSSLFDEETVQELRRIFERLKKSQVDVLVLDSATNPGAVGHCHTCPEAKQLAEELEKISRSKLRFKVLDKSEAAPYKPRYLPAFIYDTKNRNVRYYGLPSGQEFAPFIFMHEYISEGVKLPKSIVEEVEAIEVPMHVKIFVTPECPYCPLVVDFFNQVGLVNENIFVETIEAFENPLEADLYQVYYTPYVAITRIEDYDKYGAKPIATIPGYAPHEELLEVVKLAEKKLKKASKHQKSF
ncbi:MAG: thioredoxin family protein [Desulfurococcaceae archaeon]